jgi:signal peptidase I
MNSKPRKSTGKIPGFRLKGLGFVALVLAAALAISLRFHYLGVEVVGNSMRPTFEPGDFLLVDKDAYLSALPRRGDLIVARVRGDLIIKRVVALPGEAVEVKAGRLIINGVEFPEERPALKGYLDIGQGRLARGRFAILGDNRSLPASLSVFAVVARDQIVGKVMSRLRWPTAPSRPAGSEHS